MFRSAAVAECDARPVSQLLHPARSDGLLQRRCCFV